MHFKIENILIILTILFKLKAGQDIPTSPCPNIFKYTYNGNEWVGYININRIQPGETLLEAKLAVQTRLPSEYVGKVDILSKDQQANEPATYVVLFPVQNPLPKVLDITINGNTICSGPAPKGEFVTNIDLRNRLNFQCDGCETNPVRPKPNRQRPSQIQNNSPPPPQRQSQSNNNNVCGKPVSRPVALVTNGETIPKGSWPWLVGMFTKKDNLFQCGGTLVSSRTVITSAHCFNLNDEIRSENDIYMVLGRHHISRNSEGIVTYLSKIYVHPDWTGRGDTHDADIAITILQQSVQFTRSIIPACLWSSSADIPSNDPTLVGWGKDETGNISEVPKRIITKIISDAKCLRSNPIFVQITSDRTFCVGERNGQSPCAGDSGSGLLVQHNKRWYLRGIVAAAINDYSLGCDISEYSVFVDVTKFDDFVRENFVP